jgi:uncharacterized damage-inducible protein DinB
MISLEVVAQGLSGNLQMVLGTLGDFTEQDMLVRPVPNANHTTWQLGHLISAENGMVNSVTPGAAAILPEGFAAKFKKDTAKSDDAKAFPTKAEILEVFSKTRAASVEWVKKLTPADLAKPGPEAIRHLAPTVAHLVLLMPVHTAMHVGQFQVIRRKLGKPVLF